MLILYMKKTSSSNMKSGLQIFIPKLGVRIKTNILDKNIKGNTIVKFPTIRLNLIMNL